MDETGCGGRCAFERAAEVEFRAMADSVREMKERLTRLEMRASEPDDEPAAPVKRRYGTATRSN